MKSPDRSIHFWHFRNILCMASAKHAPPQTEMSGFLPRFFFPIPLPPFSSLPPHPPPPPPSEIWLFLEVQQQPLVELSSCFSLSTVFQETPSIPSIKRKSVHVVTPAGSSYGQRSEYNPDGQMLQIVVVMSANFSSWSFFGGKYM